MALFGVHVGLLKVNLTAMVHIRILLHANETGDRRG